MRNQSVVTDEYGIDPLLDVLALGDHAITVYTPYVITEDMEFNETLISQRMYGRSDLGFAILEYNGIVHPRELTRGTKIKIPDLNQVLAIVKPQSKPKVAQAKRSVKI